MAVKGEAVPAAKLILGFFWDFDWEFGGAEKISEQTAEVTHWKRCARPG
jgi:hypothetical protein